MSFTDNDIGPSVHLMNKTSEELDISNLNKNTLSSDETDIGPSICLYNKNEINDCLENTDLPIRPKSDNNDFSKEVNLSDDIGPSINLMKQSNTVSLNENQIANPIIGPSIILKTDTEYEPPKKKSKKKTSVVNNMHLSNLPKSKYYQISYMHRTLITHAQFSKSGYLVTASLDGIVKIWKKSKNPGLDFVKYYRAHLDSIVDMKMSPHEEFCATIGADKTIKIFDLLNCDMINMIKLEFMPYCCCWIYSRSDSNKYMAVSEAEKGTIYIINILEKNTIMKKLDQLHDSPIHCIIYNAVYEIVISMDEEGMIEYWSGEQNNYEFPTNLSFKYKSDTDLYELLTHQAVPLTAVCSPNGRYFAVYSSDRKIRIFNFCTGKLYRIFDEGIQVYTDTDKAKEIASMELGRRLAVEKELDRNEYKFNMTLEFDSSSTFLLLPSLMGIQVVDIRSQEVSRILGQSESVRFIAVAISPVAASHSLDPSLLMYGIEDQQTVEDIELNSPLIVCTGYKRNRLYLFTNDEPLASLDNEGNSEVDRDVLNEKPTKEEILSANDSSSHKNRGNVSSNRTANSISRYHANRLANSAIIHSSLGDIQLELYPQLTPRSVENFSVHSQNGYYNGRLFHRVIKNFMVQAGCPYGNGSGGVSIWGGEFEDEFHTSLKQDKPYLLCMANTGEKNTNGSQFFLTLKPCPWLENKHTIFGRAISGMDVIQKISCVSTDKNDKPLDDVTITSISVKNIN